MKCDKCKKEFPKNDLREIQSRALACVRFGLIDDDRLGYYYICQKCESENNKKLK